MKNTIKAIVKNENKTGLTLKDVPMPECDDNSVLIKINTAVPPAIIPNIGSTNSFIILSTFSE